MVLLAKDVLMVPEYVAQAEVFHQSRPAIEELSLPSSLEKIQPRCVILKEKIGLYLGSRIQALAMGAEQMILLLLDLCCPEVAGGKNIGTKEYQGLSQEIIGSSSRIPDLHVRQEH